MSTAISDLITELGFALREVDDALDSREMDRARAAINAVLPIFTQLVKVCHAANNWKTSSN